MFVFNILPEGYEIAVFALATLISLFTANTLMILGKDNVKGFNFTFIIQGLLMFLTLLFMYYMVGYKNIIGYLTGLFTAYSAAYVYSFALLFRHLSKDRNKAVAASFFSVLKEMFVYGLWGGIDNLAEGLATRINYFIVKQIDGGYGNVGLLDSGTKISESVWHISNSVSFIEYKSISKTTDRQAQKTVTLRLFKLTYCALAVVMAAVVCLPEWLYTDYLLTPEFAGIRKVIIGLTVGIVALGSNRILSHYFIGSGNIRYSAYCSIFGLIVLLFAGFVLIPFYGVFGAAVASSISYTAMLAFSIVVFMRQTDTTPKELLPSKTDWREALKTIRRLRR
jgi:O-antigen/teichoic acid export membrane protein